jgi:hypothetical protein
MIVFLSSRYAAGKRLLVFGAIGGTIATRLTAGAAS